MVAQSRNTYTVADYSRLSREDGDRVESDSIINQQRVIEDYCASRGELHIAEHYADDGYTGTNFDRPAFQRMLADLKAGKVDCIIVKDLSRFGRDYIDNEERRLTAALEHIRRLKPSSSEDYQDKLLTREEFLRYKADYDRQEETLAAQLKQAHSTVKDNEAANPWLEKLLKLGHMTELDRTTLAQTVKEICVFEGKHLEIVYLFSDELRGALETN